MRYLLWIASFGAAIFSGFVFFQFMVAAQGAPQEAAAAGVALCIAVIPYVLARSWDEFWRPLKRLSEKSPAPCPKCRMPIDRLATLCPHCGTEAPHAAPKKEQPNPADEGVESKERLK